MNARHIVTALWLALLAAPFVGSFLGVLIRRLPTRRPVGLARSACETCFHPLGARDLVPILSYAALRGRCRHCRAPIGSFHLAVELAACAVPISLAMAGANDTGTIVAGCGLGWTLLALGWIDAAHLLLPDVLTLPLLVAGLGDAGWQAPDTLVDRCAAAILGYLCLRAVALAYRRLRGRDGLGQGDAKLLAAAGAWSGLAALAPTLLGGALLGLAIAATATLGGRPMTATTRLPFGTPLAAAIWTIWLAGI